MEEPRKLRKLHALHGKIVLNNLLKKRKAILDVINEHKVMQMHEKLAHSSDAIDQIRVYGESSALTSWSLVYETRLATNHSNTAAASERHVDDVYVGSVHFMPWV